MGQQGFLLTHSLQSVVFGDCTGTPTCLDAGPYKPPSPIYFETINKTRLKKTDHFADTQWIPNPWAPRLAKAFDGLAPGRFGAHGPIDVFDLI